jgi:hypothetical protein
MEIVNVRIDYRTTVKDVNIISCGMVDEGGARAEIG